MQCMIQWLWPPPPRQAYAERSSPMRRGDPSRTMVRQFPRGFCKIPSLKTCRKRQKTRPETSPIRPVPPAQPAPSTGTYLSFQHTSQIIITVAGVAALTSSDRDSPASTLSGRYGLFLLV